MMKENGNRLLVWLYQAALFVGTVAVTVLFVHYGMSMFYPAPEYDDFCDNTLAQPTGNLTENQCLEIGGNWQPQSNQLVPENQKENKIATSSVSTTTGYCDRDYDCRQAYDAAQQVHDRTGFAILASIGVLIATVGFYGGSGSVLFVSLAAAGILTVLTAVARFWSRAGDWLQFGVLGLVLAVFTLTAYWKDRRE